MVVVAEVELQRQDGMPAGCDWCGYLLSSMGWHAPSTVTTVWPVVGVSCPAKFSEIPGSW